jgi:hypothetical protein
MINYIKFNLRDIFWCITLIAMLLVCYDQQARLSESQKKHATLEKEILKLQNERAQHFEICHTIAQENQTLIDMLRMQLNGDTINARSVD